METLEKTLKESKSYRDAGRKLNACHTNIRRLARQYGIDCSHFTFGKSYDDLVEREFGILVVR